MDKTTNIGIQQLHDVAHQKTATCCKCAKQNANLILLRTWIVDFTKLAQYYCTACQNYQVQEYVVVQQNEAIEMGV